MVMGRPNTSANQPALYGFPARTLASHEDDATSYDGVSGSSSSSSASPPRAAAFIIGLSIITPSSSSTSSSSSYYYSTDRQQRPDLLVFQFLRPDLQLYRHRHPEQASIQLASCSSAAPLQSSTTYFPPALPCLALPSSLGSSLHLPPSLPDAKYRKVVGLQVHWKAVSAWDSGISAGDAMRRWRGAWHSGIWVRKEGSWNSQCEEEAAAAAVSSKGLKRLANPQNWA